MVKPNPDSLVFCPIRRSNIPFSSLLHSAKSLQTLEYTNGNKESAAKLLGITSRTIYRKETKL